MHLCHVSSVYLVLSATFTVAVRVILWLVIVLVIWLAVEEGVDRRAMISFEQFCDFVAVISSKWF